MEIDDDQDLLVVPLAAESQYVRRKALDGEDAGRAVEDGVSLQQVGELADPGNHVLRMAPAESRRTVHIDLFSRQPFDAVREAKGARTRGERAEGEPHANGLFTVECQPGIVMGLRVVREDADLGAAAVEVSQVPVEHVKPVLLEHLRVRPLHPSLFQDRFRYFPGASQPFEEEERVRVDIVHLCRDVFPDLEWDLIARVCAETIHAAIAPENK